MLFSIHQLGAHIDKMFDSILLLAAGSVLHHGIVDQLESELHALRMPRPSAGIVLVLLPTALTPSLLNSSKQAISFKHPLQSLHRLDQEALILVQERAGAWGWRGWREALAGGARHCADEERGACSRPASGGEGALAEPEICG